MAWGVRELLEGVGFLIGVIGFSMKVSHAQGTTETKVAELKAKVLELQGIVDKRDLGAIQMQVLDLKERMDRMQDTCERRHNGGQSMYECGWNNDLDS